MRVVIAGENPFIQEVGELCAEAGYDTLVYVVEDFFDAVHSGYIMSNFQDVDVVVELHNESAAAKQELLLAISQSLPNEALLLTSALATSTTQAAAWTANPARVVGFGILPPLQSAGIVELAAGLLTTEAGVKHARAFWQGIGYEVAVVADGPGLVRARTVCAIINEAAGALLEGVASAEDIDKAMRLGTNYPLGPLEWADYIGVDTVLGVMTGLFDEWGEDRYRPSPLLKRMVVAGRLGKKTGAGFYEYQ